ncbi:MAG: type II toxin-antitoxin system RelE/ParE family toxin [Gallionella sp.]|nr:type II toxin-antitoxin system RelE/ParE family toxin [Gallionella sp.]
MNYRVRYTLEAKEDLKRLITFSGRARPANGEARTQDHRREHPVVAAISVHLSQGRSRNTFLHELVTSFGSGGCVALFEIEDKETVTIVAVRHQREDDYH